MANEFHNLQIKCETPYIVPDGPNAVPGHQSCAIQGSDIDQLIVHGPKYIQTAYTYSRAHLWRNFGIITGWLIFFVCLTMLGMELQRPNKGGSSVTVFKRSEAPQAVQDVIKQSGPRKDEESTEADGAASNENNGDTSVPHEKVRDIATNTAIFTWQDVDYTIPYKGGQRQLLQNVKGYVKPGRLTALMGASGSG